MGADPHPNTNPNSKERLPYIYKQVLEITKEFYIKSHKRKLSYVTIVIIVVITYLTTNGSSNFDD